jgi:hypothetical protein
MAKPKSHTTVVHATDGLGNPVSTTGASYLNPGQTITFSPREGRIFFDLDEYQLRKLGELLRAAEDGKPHPDDDPIVTLRQAYNHEAGIRFMEDSE